MQNFCAITATRGDRPEFLEHCRYLMANQTLKPGKHYIIDFPPLSNDFDLAERVEIGLSMAENDGFKYAFIIEDDDYYPANYFDYMTRAIERTNADIVGIAKTIQYHITGRAWSDVIHYGRSSLFCTGVKLPFKWNIPQKLIIDIDLWQYARDFLKGILLCFPKNMPVNIKHNTGLRGTVEHFKPENLEHRDPDFKYLQSLVDYKTFNFYKNYAQRND